MKTSRPIFLSVVTACCTAAGVIFASVSPLLAQHDTRAARTVPLPSSKEILEPVPGSPQKTNSLPMQTALSPDGRYLAIINAGFGTYESKYEQSIAVLDTQTEHLLDFPNPHTPRGAKQTLYAGLAFSSDGHQLYASMASLTNPEPDSGADAVGNGIIIYSFSHGSVVEDRILPIPLQPLTKGKQQNNMAGRPLPSGMANPYPSGIAVVPASATRGGGDEILVADNLSDDAVLVRALDGKILHRFDLSTGPTVPAAYPIAVTVTRDGNRGFVALWNASAIAELDLRAGRVLQMLPLLPPQTYTDPSSHPTAMALNRQESVLYVALANRDAVAAVSLTANSLAHQENHAEMHVLGYFDTRLPGQSYFGAVPDALALSPDGRRLYVAVASLNAIAVFDPHSMADHLSAREMQVRISALGFLPTEWYPTAVSVMQHRLYVATAKGRGTGPNNFPQRQVANGKPQKASGTTYIPTLLYGSLAVMDVHKIGLHLTSLTREVMQSNRMLATQERITFQRGANPIHHILYIIKENRSYDQVFGDLNAGNNDASLTMYGWAITPNQHKLAEQFGILDNFYVSGEVSGDGHVWSTAGITSDYTEKTWQQSYRGGQRVYDYEGLVAKGNPLVEKIPDVDDPGSGYLWTNLARHHRTYYHFGEFVASTFCSAGRHHAAQKQSPLQGTPEPAPVPCARNDIHFGEPIPTSYGGGISKYPWRIPLLARNEATKPELVRHFDPQYPDFELSFPDQLRASEFLTHFHRWATAREQGRDTMPQFILLRLPDDHTAGTTPGMPRPEASIADNDLAVGRVVDAVSHSPYWDDTAIFILEDDAQSGADHVDAHRSGVLVVSKYAPQRQSAQTPFVDHHFYTTVSVIRTMENLLGLPPMNNNDASASLMAPEFSGNGEQPAFQADPVNRENGLIYQTNTVNSPGAQESAHMDFSQADMADTQELNIILWREAKGSQPIPALLLVPSSHRSRHTEKQ